MNSKIQEQTRLTVASTQASRRNRKRANGEGAIYPRRNRHRKIISYRGVITVRWKNGRQVRQSFTAKTKDAVREMMNRALVRKHDGLMPDANGLTVAAYLEEWLKHKASEVRPSTLEGYKSVIAWHLKPILGRLRLDGLQPKHVDHLHKSLQEKKLAHRTLEYAHVVLHGALAYAVRLEMLPRNVADAVKVPRRRGEQKEMRVWTTEQAAKFLDHAREHRLYALFYTAITTGMRRGELLGLHWNEVDLENARLRVRSTLVEIRGQLTMSEPKTRASKRTIALAPDTVAVLREHRERQALECEKQGSRWQDQGFVFSSEAGTPINSGNLVRFFQRLSRAAGVPVIRLHDLRHTHASLLALKGVPAKVIADRLGHTNVAFTLQTYTHVYEEQRREAAFDFQELARGQPRA